MKTKNSFIHICTLIGKANGCPSLLIQMKMNTIMSVHLSLRRIRLPIFSLVITKAFVLIIVLPSAN
jgi:hypothetical protein